MAEISKEADMINEKSYEVSRLCEVGTKGKTGMLSSMIGSIAKVTHADAKTPVEKKCVIDYLPSIKEAEKLLETLESAKSQIMNVKELTEDHTCIDGLDDQSKEKQNSLLKLLKQSRISAENTNKMILEAESSAQSHDTVPFKAKILQLKNRCIKN